MKSIALLLGCLLALAACQSKVSTESAKSSRSYDLPMGFQELPHPPTFKPQTGSFSVLQRFVRGNWFYKVCYLYEAPKGQNSHSGWKIAKYSATLIRFQPSGGHIPQARQDELRKDFIAANTINKDVPCALPATAAKPADVRNKPQG